MTEQEWWQKNLQRPRGVRPQSLPPLSPSMLTGEHAAVQPVMEQPQNPQMEAPPPLLPQAPVENPSQTGLPMPERVEAPAKQIPPRISQEDLDYNQLQSPPKKEKLWKDILYVAGQAAANIFDTEGNYQPIERLGETQKRRKDAQAMQRIQVRNARQKFEQDEAYRKGQIKKFETDAANQTRDDNDRFVTNIRKRKYYDPTKISQVEKDRLATMGYKPEDMGSWDDRDQKTIKFGDSVWQYDPDKKAWVDSGIAKDPTLAAVEYEVDVTDQDGNVKTDEKGLPITRKFFTTSKGAANLQEYANLRKTQMRQTREIRNANVLTTAAKDNALGQYNAQKTNIDNFMQWQNNVTTSLNAALAADTTLQNNAVIQGANVAMQAKNLALQAVAEEPLPDVDDAEYDKVLETRTKRINTLYDAMSTLNNTVLTEMGKSEAGKAKAAEIRKNMSKAPDRVTYTPYKPVLVGGGSVPSQSALEGGLKKRGIKPGSSEWNQVMQAAGYK